MSSNNGKNSKSPEEVALDLALKGLVVVATAAGSVVVGTVGHRISEIKSRKKAKDLAVRENNKEIDKM